MAKQYDLTSRSVPAVSTGLRRIQTPLPVPESLPILETLARLEPLAMRGQPPVVWDRAEGFQVFDAFGNCWIDWSSGVLITNAGHNRQQVADAIHQQVSSGLLTNYCFPSSIRAKLVERLASILPQQLDKIFLLTTGSETVECAIKLCRAWGMNQGDRRKNVIVSFDKAFHGRTLGSQQAGGIPALKDWIGNLDPGFVQLAFPDGFWTEDTTFEAFERQLAEAGVQPEQVAGVLLETYQGGTGAFAPVEYMRSLRQWCDRNNALLVCDEVQAGFGRTGTLWGFEHYGIIPDLACFGKGISGSLPLSAVAGRAAIMDLPGPGSMTSTHTGNPVCCAAALASIELILSEGLAGNAKRLGVILQERLAKLKQQFPQIGVVMGKGLVAAVSCVKPGTREPDADLAWDVVRGCVEAGVLMFSPVGPGGGTVKISPPLVITEEALTESLSAFEEVFSNTVSARNDALKTPVSV